LVGLQLAGSHSTLTLWRVALAGNTAGAVLNWWLGRFASHWRESSWFPVKPQQLEGASNWFRHYGIWSLLLAWTPVVGDALTCAAGLLRVRHYRS
jgi:membrane protein YqaA with SNARE-associated domain